jgi:endogenous inhibitor of DNA gyrase (YacG/DUF329 family)
VREYIIDKRIQELWRIYPVRIFGQSKSKCHGEDTLLVQSMDHGFVTRNCPACGKPQTLPANDFLLIDLWVACPKCRNRMGKEIINKNYAFICQTCDLFVNFAALLPRWSDI